jgi:outer membrane protein assembly factor BamB
MCLLLVLPLSVTAADWPQFHGPGGAAVSPEKGLPSSWSTKENIAWKAALPGRGLSNPVVARGRIFVTAASGWDQRRLHVLCFDAGTGKKLWERQFWSTGGSTQCHPKTNMAAPTPVTDGDRVFVLFATFDVAALDRDGNLLWFRSLTADHPTVGNYVGAASSPVLWRDVLICQVENAGESFAVGINARTGTNRWQVPRPREVNWVTPVVYEHQGRPEVIFQDTGRLAAHSPETGRRLWHMDLESLSPVASPVFTSGLILTPGAKLHALRPGTVKQGPEIAWSAKDLRTGYASPLLYHGKVYTLTTKGILNWTDATDGSKPGKLRLDGMFWASLAAGDGKLYAVNEEGATTVITLGTTPKIIAVNALEDTIQATPTMANGAIYLRSDHHLYCIREHKGAS